MTQASNHVTLASDHVTRLITNSPAMCSMTLREVTVRRCSSSILFLQSFISCEASSNVWEGEEEREGGRKRRRREGGRERRERGKKREKEGRKREKEERKEGRDEGKAGTVSIPKD